MPKKIPKKEKEEKNEKNEKNCRGSIVGGYRHRLWSAWAPALVSVGIHMVALAWGLLVSWYQAYQMVILICEKKWKRGLQGYVALDREGA